MYQLEKADTNKGEMAVLVIIGSESHHSMKNSAINNRNVSCIKKRLSLCTAYCSLRVETKRFVAEFPATKKICKLLYFWWYRIKKLGMKKNPNKTKPQKTGVLKG